jgi:hypothetical protein
MTFVAGSGSIASDEGEDQDKDGDGYRYIDDAADAERAPTWDVVVSDEGENHTEEKPSGEQESDDSPAAL